MVSFSKVRQSDLENIGERLDPPAHSIERRLVDGDRREGLASLPPLAHQAPTLLGITCLVPARDVDARLTQQRSHAPDHTGNVPVLDDQQPSLREDVYM